MSSLQRLDMDKLRTHRIVATASLTGVAVVFLLLCNRSAAIGVAPPSHPAVAKQAPAEAAQTPVAEAPGELAVLYLADDPLGASMAAQPEPSPAPQQMGPPEPEDSSPTASEQRVLRSRRALETIDPREFVRRGR